MVTEMHGDGDEDGNDEDRNANMVTTMTMARVAITMATMERTVAMEMKMIIGNGENLEMADRPLFSSDSVGKPGGGGEVGEEDCDGFRI